MSRDVTDIHGERADFGRGGLGGAGLGGGQPPAGRWGTIVMIVLKMGTVLITTSISNYILGANVNSRDNDGNTILLNCISQGPLLSLVFSVGQEAAPLRILNSCTPHKPLQ